MEDILRFEGDTLARARVLLSGYLEGILTQKNGLRPPSLSQLVATHDSEYYQLNRCNYITKTQSSSLGEQTKCTKVRIGRIKLPSQSPLKKGLFLSTKNPRTERRCEGFDSANVLTRRELYFILSFQPVTLPLQQKSQPFSSESDVYAWQQAWQLPHPLPYAHYSPQAL